MALHTTLGCSINDPGGYAGISDVRESGKQRFSGSIKTDNCDVYALGQGTNVGCSIATSESTTFGDGFNIGGGGVYAMEWTAQTISIFHFSRNSIPVDLSSGHPTPSTWGIPLAEFSGCDLQEFIKNQSLVFDITFCGVWAGQDAVWKADATCSQTAATCEEYVARNPAAFATSFWEINSLKVYQQQDEESTDTLVSTPQTNTTSAPNSSQSRSVTKDRLMSTFSTSVSADLTPTSRRIITMATKEP